MARPYHASSMPYSADVSIYLQTPQRRIEVAGCLENRCTLREPIQLEPCDAELVISIDGEEYRQKVSFPHGIRSESREVEFRS